MKKSAKIIFIFFIISCGSSDDVTDGLIEIKTLQAQKSGNILFRLPKTLILSLIYLII